MEPRPIVSLIVAASRNGVIGVRGKLPWHLPADLKRFRQLTWGHPIVMGRKTFQSIGQPLPGRTNIVLTRQAQFQAPGVWVAHSMHEALQACPNAPEVFVIGGREVYQAALPLAQRIYLTRIDRDFDGDTHLFDLDPNDWVESFRQDFEADHDNPYPFSFLILNRKNKGV
jgi:dihydrofolate reductase